MTLADRALFTMLTRHRATMQQPWRSLHPLEYSGNRCVFYDAWRYYPCRNLFTFYLLIWNFVSQLTVGQFNHVTDP